MSRAPLALATLVGSFLVAAASVSAPLAAQQVVGHLPSQSPFRDIKASQHLTLEAGYFQTQQDEIGATPRSGPLFGIRYDIPISGGPAVFYARLERVSSHREAFDPSLPAATRALGDVSNALYLSDLGFALDLTGQRTWHGIIPVVGAGLGIASASRTTTRDPYTFGTQFVMRADLGIRIVPGNGLELRLMAGPTLYQNHYPAAYFVAPVNSTGATAGTPLLGAGTARSGYRTNWAYSAGLAIPLFR